MKSSRVWFVLATIFLCVGLSSALCDDELTYFKTGVSTEAFPDTTLYPSFYISSCEHTNRRDGTTYYHQFDLNGIPWYDYSAMPSGYTSWLDLGGNHEMAEKVASRCIPKTGTYRSEPETKSGLLGFTISGSPLWHYNTSSDTNALELETFDTCGGHASPNNAYHLHGWDDWGEIADGCFTGFDNNACPATIIGVALDGFPVYSAQICECVTTESDGSCSEWPTTPSGYFTSDDLDDCHGRAVDSANPTQSSDVNAEHFYEYRLSLDKPYHIGCLMGETAADAKCSQTCEVMASNAKRSDEIMKKIAMKALEDGADEHLMELNEILIEAAREVQEEEEKMKEQEEKRMKQEERKVEEEANRVNKLRSLLKELMDG